MASPPVRAAEASRHPNATHKDHSESWVEVSSQPSSSSLSSIGDEIVLTGLRVQDDRRRRARRPRTQPSLLPPQPRQCSNSSQEEYDESESDEDHVLTSSNESPAARAGARPAQLSARQQTYHTSDDDDDDADEDGTALGIGRARTRSNATANQRVFTPQPNAFSHPPSTSSHRTHPASLQPVPGSYFPRPSTHPPASHPHRHSYSGRAATSTSAGRPLPQQPPHQHTPFTRTAYSPSSHDHDAALRASLTTLLSCAAAARGLPKRPHNSPNQTWAGAPPPDPSGGHMDNFRLVPESELLADDGNDASPPPPSRSATSGARSSPVRGGSHEVEKGAAAAKRKSAAREKERVVKKKRTGPGEDLGLLTSLTSGLVYAGVSPTVVTWFVSAGVVVLVGVVGFGAGYAMGREAGLQEGGWARAGGGWGGAGGGDGGGTAAVAVGGGGGSCAKEVVRGGGGGGGLRKFRMAITS